MRFRLTDPLDRKDLRASMRRTEKVLSPTRKN